ncbi:hypothetical protein Bca52824_036784 [Brassica carinata]|uniref:D-fructose-1,6-bisphosphate 1-phosphohydrolase n=1 Tax=Brassica carinata TaxID=52824 RepID=A0A8X7S5Z9_BRACI|nr:hypothetical protein Bca52824_036784 [Brassica carinata]
MATLKSKGVFAFTLNPMYSEFVLLTQENIEIPKTGKIYYQLTLFYGGIYVYPRDAKSKNGKLRLFYEYAPMSFIVEQAQGTGSYQRVLISNCPR